MLVAATAGLNRELSSLVIAFDYWPSDVKASGLAASRPNY